MISEGGGKRIPLILLPAKKRQVTDGKKNAHRSKRACPYPFFQIEQKKSIPFSSLIYIILTKQIDRSPVNKEKVRATKGECAGNAIKSKIHFLKGAVSLCSFTVTCAS